MRDILFRGKCLVSGDFIYGDLIQYEPIPCIRPINQDLGENYDYDEIEVDNKTIGQFTGLLDKNGNKIFEGDKFAGDEPGEYYVISWNEEEATFQANLYGYNVSYGEGSQEIYDDEVTCIDTNCFELSALSSDVIIGNIHDHATL